MSDVITFYSEVKKQTKIALLRKSGAVVVIGLGSVGTGGEIQTLCTPVSILAHALWALLPVGSIVSCSLFHWLVRFSPESGGLIILIFNPKFKHI